MPFLPGLDVFAGVLAYASGSTTSRPHSTLRVSLCPSAPLLVVALLAVAAICPLASSWLSGQVVVPLWLPLQAIGCWPSLLGASCVSGLPCVNGAEAAIPRCWKILPVLAVRCRPSLGVVPRCSVFPASFSVVSCLGGPQWWRVWTPSPTANGNGRCQGGVRRRLGSGLFTILAVVRASGMDTGWKGHTW
jgi:hypothetical protein